ncbi:dihydrofolate reductase family protein [Georgenia faecalis]|uniref:Dihydrofolate reductase family protein n=1 Tax=Georgenia faecalis TaxID=2483799 RepID=A0ABV9D9T2_9MICO|nr:dihydrofolate reductase family protein [Georgenia faecalis]
MAQLLRVNAFSVSLDGYGAGPDQSLDDPIGRGGHRLHEWLFGTRTFGERFGMDGTGEGVDDLFARTDFDGIGAGIMGRNMFGPVRGPWDPDQPWTGWWGDRPPYGHPVFVLTHHPREPLEMEGGTTFHFVTGGIHEARERALAAADGADVRINGGVDTIRQFLRAGLVDRLNLALVPTLLGEGERLLGDGVDGLECIGFTATPSAVHIQLAKTA